MSDIHDIVIVGGGLTAGKAAEAVRDDGFEGRVHVFCEEDHRPYERPPLSKKFLTGDAGEDAVYVHDPDFYDEHDIVVHTGDPVTAIERGSDEVVTRDGLRQRFDRLLLATGAAPRRLPGADLDGVHLLRTLDDSAALHAALAAADQVVIVGAGWIGCEVAAAARQLQTEVTLVDPLDVPLQRVLGNEVGAVFRDLHADHGVDLRLGVGLSSVRGDGALEAVALTDGTTVETQLVVVGIGVTPRTELAEQAGLEIDDGVVTDATLATGDGRIFAAGDVASAYHPLYRRRVRVEHWANALNQGKTAGRNLLGRGEHYDRVPYFYSDQYDLGMEYVGFVTEWDDVVFRGSPQEREFIAFWRTGGVVRAAMSCNVWDVVEDLKKVVTSSQPVDADRLRDADIALAKLT